MRRAPIGGPLISTAIGWVFAPTLWPVFKPILTPYKVRRPYLNQLRNGRERQETNRYAARLSRPRGPINSILRTCSMRGATLSSS